MKRQIRDDESMKEYRISQDSHRKPTHDLSVRLGDKKVLKGKLKKIARKNQISLNRLLILIIEDWLIDYANGKQFDSFKLK